MVQSYQPFSICSVANVYIIIKLTQYEPLFTENLHFLVKCKYDVWIVPKMRTSLNYECVV